MAARIFWQPCSAKSTWIVHCTHPAARSWFLLADYIDRGPASREVLDLLLGRERTREAVFLKGNHETLVHRFLSVPAVLAEWRLCGGLETLVSYGLKPSINPGAAEQRRLAPKHWRSLYPDRTSNFSNPSSSRSVVGIFCLTMPVFDRAFPFGSRGKKIYFGFARSFSSVISGSRN